MPAIKSQPYFSAMALFLNYSGMQNSELNGEWEMPAAEACQYINEVGTFLKSNSTEEYSLLPSPVGIQIGGGEPFDRIQDLDKIISCACEYAMVPEVTTTGIWAKSPQMAYEYLSQFVGRINPLTIYTSQAIIDYFGISLLQWLLTAARELHINTTILCGIGPNVPFPREILQLEELNSRSSIIRTIPMLDQSQEYAENAKYMLKAPPLYRRCSELMGLIIFPGGDVFPCTRSYGIPEFRMGNLRNERIQVIADRVLGNRSLRRLRNEGPQYLYKACSSSPARTLLRDGYVDSCDFHRHALMDPQLTQIVHQIES